MGLEMTKLITLAHTAISAQNASTETVSNPSVQQLQTSLIRRKDVERLTGLSRSRIYDLMSREEFPRPIPLGEMSVAWLEAEVREWIARCISEGRKKGVSETRKAIHKARRNKKSTEKEFPQMRTDAPEGSSRSTEVIEIFERPSSPSSKAIRGNT